MSRERRDPPSEQDTHEFLQRLEQALVGALSGEGLSLEGRIEQRTPSGLLREFHFHVAGKHFEVWGTDAGLHATDSEGEQEWTPRRKLEDPVVLAKTAAAMAKDAASVEVQPSGDAGGGAHGLLLLFGFILFIGLATQVPGWINGGAHDTKRREWAELAVQVQPGENGDQVSVRGLLADEQFAVDRVSFAPSSRAVVVCVRVKRGASGGHRLDVSFPIGADVQRLYLGCDCGDPLWTRP